MTVEKPISKLLLQPITTGEDNVMDQSEFLAITCNLFKAQEKSRVQGAIGFGFAAKPSLPSFHWLKNWLEIFKPITERIYCNGGIIFDSHLETAP